jgi:hypothetical protein
VVAVSWDVSRDRTASVFRVPIGIVWVLNLLARKEGVGYVWKSEEIWPIRHTRAV